jgi:hypothetical protein
MNEAPLVKVMVLCNDVRPSVDDANQDDIIGTLTTVWPAAGGFPIIRRKFCVYLLMSNGRGTGTAQVACVHEDTGLTVWRTTPRVLDLGNDPLVVNGDYYRMEDVIFPMPGVYRFEYWYNGCVIATQSLTALRSMP